MQKKYSILLHVQCTCLPIQADYVSLWRFRMPMH